MPPNPFLLAADDSPALLPLLRETPALASQQDEHGYSLVHAAASYNHLDLLRTLIREFDIDVNLRDEDQETALFVVETVDAAKVLVEELGADLAVKGAEGHTAREKIAEEGDFPDVADYLRAVEAIRAPDMPNGVEREASHNRPAVPPLPEGLNISVGTTTAADEMDAPVDPEFRRRIEQLAERDDFHSDAGQAELRRLVEDAIAGERNVRPRQD
ncbi:ankyrin repeat-containing protein [Xylariaceae sp. FL0804]|nr:ankyrin repeat-containing protein [Xylariaceae sp. FL0804]